MIHFAFLTLKCLFAVTKVNASQHITNETIFKKKQENCCPLVFSLVKISKYLIDGGKIV